MEDGFSRYQGEYRECEDAQGSYGMTLSLLGVFITSARRLQNRPEIHQDTSPCWTHRDLLGVNRSYSTWCLSGIRGRMASNKGKRLGSLMTSFRSPTNTTKSIDLKEEGHKNTFYNLGFEIHNDLYLLKVEYRT